MVLYRSAWLVPVTSLVIADGAILVDDDRIVALGSYRDLAGTAGRTITLPGIVTPGLVNGHCHLELSHLTDESGKGDPRMAGKGFVAWVRELLTRREDEGTTDDEIFSAGKRALDDLIRTGVVLLADTGNREESRGIAAGMGLEAHFFLELLGLTVVGTDRALDLTAHLPAARTATAHAPYSASPRLIAGLKERCRRLGMVFSIHAAESEEEVEFLATGRGEMRAFLEDRGVWDGSFNPPGTGAIDYLDRLGVLDSQTLCVHCVQVSDAEIDLLARRGASVCLCPGSNETLGVGTAPVAKMLAAGILPALGTDSLGSNSALSLWREMAVLRHHHPEIPAEMVFRMATLGGARALGAGSRYGSLEPGKKAALIHFGCDQPLHGETEVYDFLTTVAEPGDIENLLSVKELGTRT